MAAIELQTAPESVRDARALDEYENGRYIIASSAAYNALGLPSPVHYGILEINVWAEHAGGAWFFPRTGTTRVRAAAYSDTGGWSAWTPAT